MNRAVANWGKTFLRDTNVGLRNISQAASMGVQGDLMSNERWGRECMLQLQEDEIGANQQQQRGRLSSC